MIPYIKVNNTYTIFTNIPISITPDHPNYEKIAEILENELSVDLDPLLQPTKKTVEKILLHEGFYIANRQLYYGSEQLHGYVVERVLELVDMGKPVTRMLKFLENLLQNPSNRVYEHLFKFLEKGNTPITEDGCFLAYKRIKEDYTDVHTGTIYNRVGDEVSMPRQQVDDNPNNTCSHGLHVCSFDYLAHFNGERLIVVEVRPCDVVSIPVDYDHTKMRVCRYKVISEIPISTAENIWKQRFVDLEPEEEEPEEEEPEEYRFVVELEHADDGSSLTYRCFATDIADAEEKAQNWAGGRWTVFDIYIDNE